MKNSIKKLVAVMLGFCTLAAANAEELIKFPLRLGKIDGDGIKHLCVSGDVKVTLRIQPTERK